MEEKKELEKMTAVELRELALKDYPGITGVHAMKKEELLLAIHQARGEDIKEIKKKAAGKVKADKKEIKKRIRQLKEKKNELLSGGSKKDLIRLRRKIKRLKRLTQKAAR